MQFINLKANWKTYATVVVGIGLGIAQAQGYHIPSYVDWVLGFIGLGVHRHEVQVQSNQVSKDVQLLLATVFSQITVPSPTNSVPSPSGQTDKQEQAETALLNKESKNGVK